jgi:outer membrane receptor protein involved in Fe transport
MQAKNYLTLIFITFSILLWGTQITQADNKPEAYVINGTVIDDGSKKPMEYATVRIFTLPGKELIDGMVTDADGSFNLKTTQEGRILLDVTFLGFENYQKEISLGDQRRVDLGTINLQPTSEAIDEVTVTANKHSVEYKIDRKVVHVGEQYDAVSGSAVDVLENVPSIEVDIEGNVSLRGNSNFTVLIDDRPTVLDANDALQQIPAGMIQDIEIITNPSAKFDPEGTAGIINIITKKRSLDGLSGIVSANVGLDDKYGADFLLNYRTEHFNFFAGADFNQRNYPGYTKEERRTMVGDSTHHLISEGDRLWSRQHYSGRIGVEWFPDAKNSFRISTRLGSREMRGESFTDYEEWYLANNESINDPNNESLEYDSESIFRRGGDFSSFSADYTHKFNGNKHKFDAEFMYYMRDGNERSENNLYNDVREISDGQISTESGPASGLRYRLNYQQPFSEAFNIEFGAQGRQRTGNELNEIYQYQPEQDDYIFQPLFSNNVVYDRNIHAIYGLTKGEHKDFGYQLGLRGEYTFREITLQETEEAFTIDRFDIFPTAHFSYSLNETNQLMSGYSRRINRPRGWYLEPFITWSDAYNVRQGNPDLQPEYISVYEVAYQREFGKNAFTAEVYYHVTENNIERIQSVYNETVTLHSYENVGMEYSLGTELTLNLSPLKWWDINLGGNFYDYRVKGSINDRVFDKHAFTWRSRVDNIIKLGENTRLQLNAQYSSPEEEAQEREEASFRMNAALRHSFLDNKVDLTLQARDVLGTHKHEEYVEEPDFYSYQYRSHKSPVVMLNVSWRINNYKSRQNRANGDGGEEGMGEEGM